MVPIRLPLDGAAPRPSSRPGAAAALWLLLLVLLMGRVAAALPGAREAPRLRAGLAGIWPPAVAGGAVEVRALTFNIRHGWTPAGRVDLEAAAAVLARLEPDFAGLQEVDRLRWRSGVVDQPAWLAERLGLQGAFGPALRYVMGQYGNALLSRWPIVAAETHALPGAGEPRAALVARVDTPAGRVRVVVTHLGLSRAAREAQAAALAALLADDPSLPTLLLGDFNAAPGSPELEPLRRLLRHAGGGPSFPAGEPRVQPDQIYASPHWEVLRAWAEPAAASDHLPVVAELRLGVPGAAR